MRILSAVREGMESTIAAVECTVGKGFAGVKLIGNTTEVVRDGRERARAAIENLGLSLPQQTLILNIAPAEVKKDGSQLDLPMAVAMAIASGARINLAANGQGGGTEEVGIDLGRWMFVGELGLQGDVRPIRGVVPFAVAAMQMGLEGMVMSPKNMRAVEALIGIEDGTRKPLRIMAFATLREVLDWLAEPSVLTSISRIQVAADRPMTRTAPAESQDLSVNFDDMILVPEMERVALASVAGMHSLLLRGSPGCGKSMFASRLPSIMPRMVGSLHLESLRIHSTFQAVLPRSLLDGIPPFRAPHHQASASALLGSEDRPGEMALSHGGLLFLDELPEFRRDLLESLREPLETGEVRVSRAKFKVVWKARMLLVAACNNCPCGWSGSAVRSCRCMNSKRMSYQARLSGPLLQRVDIHINVPERRSDNGLLFVELARDNRASFTRSLREKVVRAREQAFLRQAETGVAFNGMLKGSQVLRVSRLQEGELRRLINKTMPRAASPRSVLRCLRVARTLADLDGCEQLAGNHLEEAYQWLPEPCAAARGEMTPDAGDLAVGG